jgi:hypothetical protein
MPYWWDNVRNEAMEVILRKVGKGRTIMDTKE